MWLKKRVGKLDSWRQIKLWKIHDDVVDYDVARLHAEIYDLNDALVGFCFIRDIDET